jgi:hypothetical protein
MTEGILFVLSEPGAVEEPEFHDWYDDEHAPLRMTVPGIRTGRRYRAVDGQTPTWLAYYDLDLEVLDSPEYQSLLDNRSDRERDVLTRIGVLDRRVYELVDDQGERQAGPAPMVVSVGVGSSEPAELDEWYRREHVPLLLAVPGWHRTRRYRLVDGDGPESLALHEVSGQAVFDTDAYRAATGTPWRKRVMASVTTRDRRLFGFHRDFPPVRSS